ncbi:expressed unknown protein [Seminavis robusta]|uniref:Uncharacterized protein n=1 Tax=Seminavis robusta TaxID=568900 RepID=A0A9N8E6D3_9STRA|nr:expressed unknown protein [Seminavis robusta]|eukprot:Sro598_g173000.1 n/a (263) ;mRNA; r:21273-22061
MKGPLLTITLISFSLSGSHADSVRRSLKGLVFNGAPGKCVGRGCAHDQETTEATLVGHLTENNTVVLDVTPPPSDLPASAETTAGVSNPPPSSPTDNEEEFRQEEEKELKKAENEGILAALLGSFLGSFTAVAIFMALAYRMMLKKWETVHITDKHTSIEVDVDTVDFSTSQGFKEDMADVTLEQTTTHSMSSNRLVTTTTCWDEYMDSSFSSNSANRYSFVGNPTEVDVDEEPESDEQLSAWSEGRLPKKQHEGGKCFVIV